MKLIQLNIWGGKLEYQLDDFVRAQRPDILCMQEVNDMPGKSGALFRTLSELKNVGEFDFSHMSASYTSKFQRRETSFGNAVLSRFAIDDAKTIFTNGTYNPNFDVMDDDFNVRNLQKVVLATPQGDVTVFNHHGFLVIGSKEGNKETERHMQLILDEVKSVLGPCILVGDFNLAPTSRSIGMFDGVLTNLSRESGVASTYTHLNSNNVICDYIFINDKIRVNNFDVSDVVVSDHKALILDFELV